MTGTAVETLFHEGALLASTPAPSIAERMVEWTVESQKVYADPFNEVEVDVLFEREGRSWRVPMFWRGGQRWTVRFAPPTPGEYRYRLHSTDAGNLDLNGQEGRVRISAYQGANPLLQHGALKISRNKRYFEHADGTPFYWLGDTWWQGLSTRFSWEGFQQITADRKAKGFTLIQLVAGLVPPEELAPLDPGYCNEGGPVWEAQFERLNPQFFDAADRRLLHLIDAGLVPAIFGAWNPILHQMSVAQVKQHWRYLIARYGAYPMIWVVGGELRDPPPEATAALPPAAIQRGWTDIARYVRATDPYGHPVSAHESHPPFDFPLQDESLTDFDLIQSSHFGWPSIAVQVAQINTHYARAAVTKPVVQGEIGYEKLGQNHLENFQRTAFWLSMLNGAAGHTYGADGVFEGYTADKPLHRVRWSFLSWQEGMRLPGACQLGLGAKLLRQYQWWRFEPHPQWVTPRGTTLLEPLIQVNGFDIGRKMPGYESFGDNALLEACYPGGEWAARGGDFRRPYAAGIAGEVRFIYMPPQIGFYSVTPPTVLGLEPGIRYDAYLWEPTAGIRIDLGAVGRPAPGEQLFADPLPHGKPAIWTDADSANGASRVAIRTLKNLNETNMVASVDASSAAEAGLVLRYRNADNYLAAIFSTEENLLYLIDRRHGSDGPRLGATPVGAIGGAVLLSAEAREDKMVASLTDGAVTYTTPIVDIAGVTAGSAGLMQASGAVTQRFRNYEARRSPQLLEDEPRQRKLYGACGEHRGDLAGDAMSVGSLMAPGWSSFGQDKHILLDAYRPERMPTSGDWLLVLESSKTACRRK